MTEYTIYAGPHFRAHDYCHATAHAPLPTPTRLRPPSRPRVCAHAYCHAHAYAPLPTPTHMRPLTHHAYWHAHALAHVTPPLSGPRTGLTELTLLET